MPTDATLREQALRYAAEAITPAERACFEARLAVDADARAAVEEVVRLSAAVLRCPPPAPDPSLRQAIGDRLRRRPWWLARRAYRGHPLLWLCLGAASAAVAVVAGLHLSPSLPPADPRPAATLPRPGQRASVPAFDPPRPTAELPAVHDPLLPAEEGPDAATAEAEPEPVPPAGSVAEWWADLSSPDRLEKALEQEFLFRHKLRELGIDRTRTLAELSPGEAADAVPPSINPLDDTPTPRPTPTGATAHD